MTDASPGPGRDPGPVLPSDKTLRRQVALAVSRAYLTNPPHAALCLMGVLVVTGIQMLASGSSGAVWLLLANLLIVNATLLIGVSAVIYMTPQRRRQTLWGTHCEQGAAGLICHDTDSPSEVKFTTLGAWPRRGNRLGKDVGQAAAKHYTALGKTVVFTATRWLAPVYERHGYVRERPILFGLLWTMKSA